MSATPSDTTSIDHLIYPTVMSLRGVAAQYLRSDPSAVDDVLSTACEKAWRRRHSFEGDRIAAWLHAVVRNAAIDYCRRMKRAGQTFELQDYTVHDHYDIYDYDAMAQDLTEITRLDAAQEREELLDLLDELPPIYRETVELRYGEDLSYEETAKRLGVPIGTVMSRLHRAHSRLRVASESGSSQMSLEYENR